MENNSQGSCLSRKRIWFIGLLLIFVLIYCRNYFVIENEDGEFNVNLKEIFDKLDVDHDGKLNFKEFLNIIKFISHSLNLDTTATKLDYKIQIAPEIKLLSEDSIITIESEFQPLVLTSLSKTLEDLQNQGNNFQGVFDWNEPAYKWRNFAAKHFSVFLPPNDMELVPGNTWWIFPNSVEGQTNQLSSARYYPPQLLPKFHSLHALLSMLHVHPFLNTRFAPRGTVAILRAVSTDTLDIMFRLHAEFQLNSPPRPPFWFTPSQFQGRIIINRNGSTVFYFHMGVPSDRKLNVDMEWLNGPRETDGMEVDIGYIPKLSLASTGPSVQLGKNVEINNTYIPRPSNYEKLVSSLQWSEEIETEEATRKLEQKFYPFKQIQYYNFTEACNRAKEENKLLHVILLWGALDDQSC